MAKINRIVSYVIVYKLLPSNRKLYCKCNADNKCTTINHLTYAIKPKDITYLDQYTKKNVISHTCYLIGFSRNKTTIKLSSNVEWFFRND